jgi:hypothetical protein
LKFQPIFLAGSDEEYLLQSKSRTSLSPDWFRSDSIRFYQNYLKWSKEFGAVLYSQSSEWEELAS